MATSRISWFKMKRWNRIWRRASCWLPLPRLLYLSHGSWFSSVCRIPMAFSGRTRTRSFVMTPSCTIYSPPVKTGICTSFTPCEQALQWAIVVSGICSETLWFHTSSQFRDMCWMQLRRSGLVCLSCLQTPKGRLERKVVCLV